MLEKLIQRMQIRDSCIPASYKGCEKIIKGLQYVLVTPNYN